MRLPTPDRRRATAGVLSSLLLILALAVPVAAQSPSPDADLRALPTQVIRPNDRSGARPAYVVTSRLPAFTGHVRFEDSGGGPCDLIVRAGGHVSFENSFVELVGDLLLEDGGVARMVDTEFQLWCRFPREFRFSWEGGWLDSCRTTIGGATEGARFATFHLFQGLWTARDTVVQVSSGILLGNVALDQVGRGGGTLIADGLYAGKLCDVLSMSGYGHATLRNSHFPINLMLYDPGASGSTIDIDLSSGTLSRRVYGDAAVHQSVTHNVPDSPFRLELVDTTVMRWALTVRDAGPSSSSRTYRLEGDSPPLIAIHAENLTGSPALVGPWSSAVVAPDRLPALPCIREPDHHPIPAGCGVRIGSTTFMAASSGPVNVSGWSFYLDGPGTDFTIRGASRIIEAFVSDGVLRMEGINEYEMGVVATTVGAHNTGRVVIRGATLGNSDGVQGEVLAAGQGTVLIEDVKLRHVLLRTGAETFQSALHGVDQGSIVMRRALPPTQPNEELTVLETRAGSITIEEAAEGQSNDLQNLDFESRVRADGLPAFWDGAGVSGQASSAIASNLAPSAGSLCYRYLASSSAGYIAKTIRVEPLANLELYGHVRVANSSGSERIEVAVEGSNGRRSVVSLNAVSGAWTAFHVPAYRVDPSDTQVRLVVSHAGARAGAFELLLDAFEVRVASFWESDNLLNLDFEEPLVRMSTLLNGGSVPPDYWWGYGGVASVERADRAPGSTGQQSVRLDVVDRKAAILKRLRFLSPGQVVRFEGWVKCAPAPGATPTDVWIQVSEGEPFWNPNDAHQVRQRVPAGAGWQRFSVSYTVPAEPVKLDFTTFSISGGAEGDVVLVDDVELEIR